MQKSQISCLFTVMSKYCATARDMEQVIMLPSLLREVPMETQGNTANNSSNDLYEQYIKLKTVKISLENGFLPLAHHDLKMEGNANAVSTMDEEAFYYHLLGLFQILNQLTQEARELTSKYKDLLGATR
ncbi:thyroid hormone-inducible hepatic protein [Bombina bombina]|uniref:thyroid hormone-inducible hepatic protein n=1 Tax=Bombina bombina TaxID=8345 RepID=UPI00235AD25C|nr:thyroid hormone-inducible hepatic protein [Bombina bombina]